MTLHFTNSSRNTPPIPTFVFSDVFVLNNTSKLQPRSTPCIFLGYPSNHKGYRCLDLHTKDIIISRHVVFDESVFPFGSMSPHQSPNYDFLNIEDQRNCFNDPTIPSQPSLHHPDPSTTTVDTATQYLESDIDSTPSLSASASSPSPSTQPLLTQNNPHHTLNPLFPPPLTLIICKPVLVMESSSPLIN